MLCCQTEVVFLVGNHDVGYGADLTQERLERFEHAFGSVEETSLVSDHLFVKYNNLNVDSATDQVICMLSYVCGH